MQVVNAVLCINPGTLSKKRGAGTFSSLSVEPKVLTKEEREAGKEVAHSVFERVRVDVVKI